MGMGLKEGDRVEFVIEDDEVVLRPARTRHNPFDKYMGAFPYFKTIDEINAWVREMREDRSDRD
jgi:bifunctional DNA-binding transcriptional regulator/antitoxin component of YhaV-PrlF toxin-antitoxin module